MDFSNVRAGNFQFNFKHMRAHKWRETWQPRPTYGSNANTVPREEIVTRYRLKETADGLALVLLDCKVEASLTLECFMKQEEVDEVLRAWTDWVFERDVLRK